MPLLTVVRRWGCRVGDRHLSDFRGALSEFKVYIVIVRSDWLVKTLSPQAHGIQRDSITSFSIEQVENTKTRMKVVMRK